MYAPGVLEGLTHPTCNLLTQETATSRLWQLLRCAVALYLAPVFCRFSSRSPLRSRNLESSNLLPVDKAAR